MLFRDQNETLGIGIEIKSLGCLNKFAYAHGTVCSIYDGCFQCCNFADTSSSRVCFGRLFLSGWLSKTVCGPFSSQILSIGCCITIFHFACFNCILQFSSCILEKISVYLLIQCAFGCHIKIEGTHYVLCTLAKSQFSCCKLGHYSNCDHCSSV